ncbi:hypothetical protein ACHAWO_013295 [Cyclotella atomus]|jgi:hypothetical protein|uniref:Uncharacterized protein n=1 Tax=Cyclotella atomus TaxID=382360 RepID=A0ABD3PIH7_9STRA
MPDRNLVNGSRGIVKSFQEARVEFDDEDDYKFNKYSRARIHTNSTL